MLSVRSDDRHKKNLKERESPNYIDPISLLFKRQLNVF
ncbi:hypothetical protein BN130_302 [Cronobacter malonaticus 507]|nr:hypothetical protein BN130_302 [Cronobacter malonaticus 507]